jgi:hypothetical protein
LFRERFDTEKPFDCKNPRPLRDKGLSKLVADRAIRCGVMQKVSLLEGETFGKRRNKVFRTHGFRKHVTNKMKQAGVSELDIDKLLGHKSRGLTGQCYYRPDEDELLGEYLKAVDVLTIDNSKRLQRENEMLKVRKSEYQYLKEQVEENKQHLEHMYKKLLKGDWEQQSEKRKQEFKAFIES